MVASSISRHEMMLRHTFLLGAGLVALAGAADAQPRPRSREDLLDDVTRHIQICSELTDQQARLSCYDKMQNQVGNIQPSTPQPTPLANNPPPGSFGNNPPPPPSSSFGNAPPTPPGTGAPQGGLAASGRPLQPPPLTTPGGGVATLGGPQNRPGTFGDNPPPPPSASADPDAAFDPNGGNSYQSGPSGARPQPPVRRTGPRPLPNFSQPMPLVTLTANNLTYGAAHYWQVSISLTSNTSNTVDSQIQCSFMNGGRSVGEAYFGPVALAPGERVSTDLIGPPTTAYVDSTNCRVLSP
jgi:hypothetical protein